jgi:hypothetical protein
VKVPVAEAEAADAAQSTPEDVVDEAVTAMEVDRGPILDEQPVVDEATIES